MAIYIPGSPQDQSDNVEEYQTRRIETVADLAAILNDATKGHDGDPYQVTVKNADGTTQTVIIGKDPMAEDALNGFVKDGIKSALDDPETISVADQAKIDAFETALNNAATPEDLYSAIASLNSTEAPLAGMGLDDTILGDAHRPGIGSGLEIDSDAIPVAETQAAAPAESTSVDQSASKTMVPITIGQGATETTIYAVTDAHPNGPGFTDREIRDITDYVQKTVDGNPMATIGAMNFKVAVPHESGDLRIYADLERATQDEQALNKQTRDAIIAGFRQQEQIRENQPLYMLLSIVSMFFGNDNDKQPELTPEQAAMLPIIENAIADAPLSAAGFEALSDADKIPHLMFNENIGGLTPAERVQMLESTINNIEPIEMRAAALETIAGLSGQYPDELEMDAATFESLIREAQLDVLVDYSGVRNEPTREGNKDVLTFIAPDANDNKEFELKVDPETLQGWSGSERDAVEKFSVLMAMGKTQEVQDRIAELVASGELPENFAGRYDAPGTLFDSNNIAFDGPADLIAKYHDEMGERRSNVDQDFVDRIEAIASGKPDPAPARSSEEVYAAVEEYLDDQIAAAQAVNTADLEYDNNNSVTIETWAMGAGGIGTNFSTATTFGGPTEVFEENYIVTPPAGESLSTEAHAILQETLKNVTQHDNTNVIVSGNLGYMLSEHDASVLEEISTVKVTAGGKEYANIMALWAAKNIEIGAIEPQPTLTPQNLVEAEALEAEVLSEKALADLGITSEINANLDSVIDLRNHEHKEPLLADLVSLGYVDTDSAVNFAASVRELQAAHGLEATGEVDIVTLTVIDVLKAGQSKTMTAHQEREQAATTIDVQALDQARESVAALDVNGDGKLQADEAKPEVTLPVMQDMGQALGIPSEVQSMIADMELSLGGGDAQDVGNDQNVAAVGGGIDQAALDEMAAGAGRV